MLQKIRSVYNICANYQLVFRLLSLCGILTFGLGITGCQSRAQVQEVILQCIDQHGNPVSNLALSLNALKGTSNKEGQYFFKIPAVEKAEKAAIISLDSKEYELLDPYEIYLAGKRVKRQTLSILKRTRIHFKAMERSASGKENAVSAAVFQILDGEKKELGTTDASTGLLNDKYYFDPEDRRFFFSASYQDQGRKRSVDLAKIQTAHPEIKFVFKKIVEKAIIVKPPPRPPKATLIIETRDVLHYLEFPRVPGRKKELRKRRIKIKAGTVNIKIAVKGNKRSENPPVYIGNIRLVLDPKRRYTLQCKIGEGRLKGVYKLLDENGDLIGGRKPFRLRRRLR